MLTLPVFGQQEVRFRGPVTGWVYDPPSQSIRLVTGLPGGALLGPSVLNDVAWASVAPGTETPLAIAVAGGQAVLLRGETTIPVEGLASLAAAEDLPRFAVWAPGGSSVVLVWERSAQRIDTALTATTPLAGSRQTWQTLPSGDGVELTAATLATANGLDLYFALASQGIYRVSLGANSGGENSGEQEPVLVAPAARCTLLAASSEAIWALDDEAFSLLRIPLGSNEAAIVLQDEVLLNGASALLVNREGSGIYLANGKTRKLHHFARSGTSWVEPAAAADLDVAATLIAPMARQNVYLLGLRASSTDPLYLWDEGSGNVFFVPVETVLSGASADGGRQ